MWRSEVWRACIVLTVLTGATGCYRSHARGEDVGPPPDVSSPDVWAGCAPADECNPALALRDGICAPPLRALEDGFEDASPSFGNPVGARLSCWVVVDGDADIVSDGGGFTGPPHSGRQALDLNGWTSGTIARDVRVVPGRSYLLSFAYTRNPQMEAPTATGEVSIDGAVALSLSASPRNTASDLQWSRGVLEVTARREWITISFRSTNPGNGGLYLDSVTLDEL